MKARILVTRPQPGAARTAARLAEAGFEPLVLPLTQITPLPFAIPEMQFDAVVLTSAQALAALTPDAVAQIDGLPVFAVGETTAAAAKAAGFTTINTAGGEAASIASLVRLPVRTGGKLLYLCGKVRRPDLEHDLRAAGFDVVSIETYDAKPVLYRAGEAEDLLGTGPVDAVVHMSRQAAMLFLALLADVRMAQRFRGAVQVCFSNRIAEAFAGTECRLAVTSAPAEAALLEELRELFPQ